MNKLLIAVFSLMIVLELAQAATRPRATPRRAASAVQPPFPSGLAQRVLQQQLSPSEQADCNWVFDRESGPNRNAGRLKKNPRSTAFGIGQLLIATRRRYGALLRINPATTDAEEQTLMALAYVFERYRTCARAKQWWLRHHWY